MSSKTLRRFKNWFYRLELWRNAAYARGHSDGVDAASKIDARTRKWIDRLETYYYSHINDCQKNKCEICKGANDAQR